MKRSLMRRLFALVLALAALPRGASACASCISSAFGDQTYNWAYIGLMFTPLVLCGVIGGVLAWCDRARLREMRRSPATNSSLFNEESA